MNPSEVTLLLQRLAGGDQRAAGDLLPAVYDELRRIAAANMRRERVDHTLQATALVSEVYLRLLGPGSIGFEDRAHFFAVAANAMRRILIDHARARSTEKRHHGGQRMPLTVVDLGVEHDPAEILALDEALSRLEESEPDVARVVKLKFFAGLSGDEVAQALAMSPRQVDRLWSYARAYLFRELGGE